MTKVIALEQGRIHTNCKPNCHNFTIGASKETCISFGGTCRRHKSSDNEIKSMLHMAIDVLSLFDCISWLKWLFRRQQLYITSVPYKFGWRCQNRSALNQVLFACMQWKWVFSRQRCLKNASSICVYSEMEYRFCRSYLLTSCPQRPNQFVCSVAKGRSMTNINWTVDNSNGRKHAMKIFTYQMHCFIGASPPLMKKSIGTYWRTVMSKWPNNFYSGLWWINF